MVSFKSWKLPPLVLDNVVFQLIQNCWAIGIGRQLTSIGRIGGLLDSNESLSIQYLLNGVDQQHLNQSGAIDSLERTKDLLINHGIVLESLCPLTFELGRSNENFGMNVTKFKVSDLIVHKLVEYASPIQFYDEMIRCLNMSPVAVAMPTFGSFVNVGSVRDLFYNQRRTKSAFSTYHVMLLCGAGVENGFNFLELQNSAGEQFGVGGYFRVAAECNAISHFVEVKGFHCSPPNPENRFSVSIPVDLLMYQSHIHVSKAQAKMLATMGLITNEERDLIAVNLNSIEQMLVSQTFAYSIDQVNVVKNIEAALTKSIGVLAKKLQRGCSANDIVATNFRLWCRLVIDEIVRKISLLQTDLVRLAVKYKSLIVPCYTSSRAQLSLPQLLCYYIEQLERDSTRYNDCKVRLNMCPLGVGDVAGTYLSIDRFVTARELGFTNPMRNSIDAVSDRDFVMEFVSTNSITSKHLASLGQDWMACEKLGIISSLSSNSTGCTLFQQKTHPHPMKLISEKDARVTACLSTVFSLNGCPLTFSQDFEMDKESMYSSYKTVTGMIDTAVEFAQTATFNQVEIKTCLDSDTLGCYILHKGNALVTSLDMFDKVVGMCVSKGCKLENLSSEDLKHLGIDADDLIRYMDAESSVNKFIYYGSTGPESVDCQLHYWINKLGCGY